MLVYLNGRVVADINSLDDADVSGPLFSMPAGAFRIGTRGDNWCSWRGRLDDFRVYDYPLSAEEVAYIATRGTGQIFVPVVSAANIKSSSPQIVNFDDLALMVDEWLTTKLWP
jgi:hypothetical protein